ncbi:MAG: hypothetical protein QXP27_08970, partial [Candidatus Methanomethyliaceae archaeon]
MIVERKRLLVGVLLLLIAVGALAYWYVSFKESPKRDGWFQFAKDERPRVTVSRSDSGRWRKMSMT